MTSAETALTGRARTVLVFGDGPTAVAVLSAVLVHAEPVRRRAQASYAGVVAFGPSVRSHIETVLVPIVDEIGDALHAPRVRYEFSASNVGAASAMDTGSEVSGFSADLPLVLAMLSARLGIEVPEDLVSTGHVASTDGDIRFVRQIPAKLSAVLADHSIRVFVHPALCADASVQGLLPRELEACETALQAAGDRIRTVAVSSIDELVLRVFPESAVLAGSLRTGFFQQRVKRRIGSTAIRQAVEYLSSDNQERFLRLLEKSLLQGDHDEARGLVAVWTSYFIGMRKYPNDSGRKLYQLILSLPPNRRPAIDRAPLLPVASCIAMSQFAQESDHEDVGFLYKAAGGAVHGTGMPVAAQTALPPTSSGNTDASLDVVLREIAQEAVANRIALPIDSARSTYVMDGVIADSHAAFLDTVTAFYLHVLRHTGVIAGTVDAGVSVGPEAHALLERTFARDGGLAGALAEAMSGTRGGFRFILDAMTDQLKREHSEKYVAHILRQAIDPMDWDAKVAFMGAFLRRVASSLPGDISIETPERYAAQYDTIVRAYVSSMDQVRSVLKGM